MKTKVNKLDFRDQPIYVGMDVHKKSWKVCIMNETMELNRMSMDPDPGVLVRHLKRNYPGADYYAAYEAGFSGFWIHEQLTSAGVNCLVVHPGDIPTTHKEKDQKRDRSDARKLARSLRGGMLNGIHIPDKSQQQMRGLLRDRRRIIGNRTRCKNRIKGILFYYGISIPTPWQKRAWGKDFISWLEELKFDYAYGNLSLSLYVHELKYLNHQIAGLEKMIRKFARDEPYRTQVELVESIPGIGLISAMIILTEIGDIHRFKRIDHLCSYIGLVPKVSASGEHEHVGPMTKRGNKHLKYVLIESAWRAVRKDPALLQSFEQLCMRMKKNDAIIRITRKLLNRIRYVLKHQCPYEIRRVA